LKVSAIAVAIALIAFVDLSKRWNAQCHEQDHRKSKYGLHMIKSSAGFQPPYFLDKSPVRELNACCFFILEGQRLATPLSPTARLYPGRLDGKTVLYGLLCESR
jgi:hypothetical protein